MRILPVAALSAGVLMVGALGAPAAHAALPWAPCMPAGFQCAPLEVPLDYTGAQPGTVRLAAKRVPAASDPSATAVVALAGGPGQAATPLAKDFASLLAPALAQRDLIIYDQRGTGTSNPLSCPAFRGVTAASQTLSSVVRQCATEIGGARAHFTTADSVADLEALRIAGGYERLILLGVSYGTKVALAYASAHPATTEALVLDSVVTPEGPDALRRSSLNAVPRAIGQDLCGAGACAQASADAVGDIRKLEAKLDQHAVSGPVYSPGGHRYTATLTAGGLLSILLAGDLNPTLRAELPGAVRAALTGDVKPILRLSVRSAGLSNAARGYQQVAADSEPTFFVTTCEENLTLPWLRTTTDVKARVSQAEATIKALPPGATGVFPRGVTLGGLPSLCLGYPTASPPPAPPGPLPDVNALVIDGQSDLRTPLEDAQSLATRLPRAQTVAVPHTGHSVLGSEMGTCASTAVAAFFAGQPVAACGPEANPFSPTARPPSSFSRVARIRGFPAKVGRTLESLRLTINDGRRQVIGEALSEGGGLVTGSGGLRGGSVRLRSRTTLSYRSYEFVPGVRLNGTFHQGGTSHYTVSGLSAAHGSITITRSGRVFGRLDGRRVKAHETAARVGLRLKPERLPSIATAMRRGRMVAATR